ncbi:hypothetical protein NPIL_324961, partial [Nephila pilipes]
MNSQKPKLKDICSDLHFENSTAEQQIEPSRTIEKEIDSLENIQSHTQISKLKEEQKGMIAKFTTYQSNDTEFKSAGKESENKRKSSYPALKSMSHQMNLYSSEDDNPIYKNEQNGKSSSGRLINKSLIYKRNNPQYQERSEWGNKKCSASHRVHEKNYLKYMRNRA